MLTLTIILALTLALILTLINPNHNTNPNCYNAFPMAPSKLHSSPLSVWQLFTSGITLVKLCWTCAWSILANMNSSSCSLHAVARPSAVCLSVCCRKRSCTLLRRLQFSAIFLWHLVRCPSDDIHRKFYEDHPRGTPPPAELNTRGVAKYSHFGPIDGYIYFTWLTMTDNDWHELTCSATASEVTTLSR